MSRMQDHGKDMLQAIRGFPKNRGTILGVPIIRIIVVWGLYWGPPFWETTIQKQEGDTKSL